MRYAKSPIPEKIAKRINAITNVDVASLESYIEVPPNTELGDFAFPCFKLAKELKKVWKKFLRIRKNNYLCKYKTKNK